MQKIVDLHCDTIGEIQAGVDIEKPHPDGHLDIPRLHKGNISCQVFACFVSSMVPEDHAFSEVIKLLELTDDICQRYSNHLQKAEDNVQIKKTIDSNKIAIVAAVENGHVIENNLQNLENLRLQGSRYMTLTHMKNLNWAASSGESDCDFEGLTNFGEKVVAAMNEFGIIIDVSHVHESSFWATLKISRRPVIASHSNSSTLCPAARNLTDNQIKAIADTGGMIGINFYPGFLNAEYLQKNIDRCDDLFESFDTIEEEFWQNPQKKMQAFHDLGIEFRERMSDTKVGYESIVDHISYVIDLVGEDFVGFGSDFDGLPALPEGMSGCDIFPSLLSLMKDRGYSDSTINKICYENFLRVLQDNY
jgi:membrane dipeptidase